MKVRIAVGIVISLVFIYLAFHEVNFQKMLAVIKDARYEWLFPAIVAMLLSHWLRAMRWQYLMEPVKEIKVHPLFSALMIGYAANNIFPLRLGEFLRAFAIAKSQRVSKTSSFATVIVDRLLDILSLLLVMAVTIFLFPLPENIKRGAYVISAGTIGVIVFIVFLMEKTDATLTLLSRVLPKKVYAVVQRITRSFLQGFMVFKKSEHYLRVISLSVGVWLLYAVVVYISFFIFDFNTTYSLDFHAALVVLVIISIGLMIPSSPGFVGTYHWFCIMSLSLVAAPTIPKNDAISFAVITHAMNTIPVTIVGLSYFWKENLHFSDAVSEKEAVEHASEDDSLPDTLSD
ncbi:MAG: lysylphosphatidylglycerol synthase transmembrane domain-containing protein [bacterium]